MYESVLRPLLFRLPAEPAHQLGLWGLGLLDLVPEYAAKLARERAAAPKLTQRIAGLTFPNPIGVAAGLDKNAEALPGLFACGFGFVEVGTVTPRPQDGNEAPRLFRLPEHHALINRMGFNNAGMDALASRLFEFQDRPGPVGVNLGKNKATPNAQAAEDYAAGARRLGPLADYLVVNLSSPNTPGLRELQEPAMLEGILRAVRAEVREEKPVFLKIAPDLTDEAIDAAVDVAISCDVDGLVCTNTTVGRPVDHEHNAERGGLSGKPLRDRATEVVRRVFRHTNGTMPIIGVGGVFSVDDAWEKICAGACLVQVYTGFIYEGPELPLRLKKGLTELVENAGLSSVSQAVGRDA